MARQFLVLCLVSVLIVLVRSQVWAQSINVLTAIPSPQRPNFAFTADPPVTPPGTLEIEIGATRTLEIVAVPTVVKFTPDVTWPVLQGTELSLFFDLIQKPLGERGRGTLHFSDQVGIAGQRPVYVSERCFAAVAPYTMFHRRAREGLRFGVIGMWAWSTFRQQVALNLDWGVATKPDPDTPRHLLAASGEYIHALGQRGFWSHWGVFAGWLLQKGSGTAAELSFEQGLSVVVSRTMMVDFRLAQHGIAAQPFSLEATIGLTYNFGRIQPRSTGP